MSKHKELIQINEIIERFFRSRNWTQRIDGYNLFDSWEDVLPPQFASNTKPLKIQNNILFLIVKNHVWANEIKIRKGEIIDMINRKIGENSVKELIIRIDRNKFIGNENTNNKIK